MIDADNMRPTVENSISDANSLYNETKKIISLRMEHTALQADADIEFIYVKENEYPLIYKRSSENEDILIAVNRLVLLKAWI